MKRPPSLSLSRSLLHIITRRRLLPLPPSRRSERGGEGICTRGVEEGGGGRVVPQSSLSLSLSGTARGKRERVEGSLPLLPSPSLCVSYPSRLSSSSSVASGESSPFPSWLLLLGRRRRLRPSVLLSPFLSLFPSSVPASLPPSPQSVAIFQLTCAHFPL